MKDIGLVPRDHLPYVWEGVCEVIEEHGKPWLEIVDLKEVGDRCLQGELDLWLGTTKEIKLVMFCGWERHAKASYYHVMWIGGAGLADCIKEGLAKLEQYACLSGATEVRLGGRQGWEKLLKPYGYSSRSVELRKNVVTCWRH